MRGEYKNPDIRIISKNRGLVPDAVLRRFVAEWKVKAVDRWVHTAEEDPEGVFAWGVDPCDGNLIFLPVATAIELAEFHAAKVGARTWKEWSQVSGWKAEDMADYCFYPTFEEYMEDHDEGNEAETRVEYENRVAIGWRPPRDDDPFDHEEWDCFWFERNSAGDLCPRTAMSGCVPEEIVREFGSLGCDLFGAEIVEFGVEAGPRVIHALEGMGYSVVREQVLVDCGMGFLDGEGLGRRVKVYF